MLKCCFWLNVYRKNPITIRILLQYAPETLTGNLWENVSLAVQYAPDIYAIVFCSSSSNHVALTIIDQQ